MESKTPNFDKELDKILAQLKPGKKVCRQCKSDFRILKEDIEMYRKLRVPPSTMCFDCRRQRRYGFYNNVLKFFKKECSAHKGEQIVSTFTPESRYQIFDLKYWWSDKWDRERYAREYDFDRSFFGQFEEFNQMAPHPAILSYYRNLINSPYTISTFDLKDSYFTSMSGWGQNLNYCYWTVNSNDCFDMLDCDGCEKCYELVGCASCYNCHFSQECENCIDSAFLYDCRYCQNCFGCFNLRHKKYCFFNEQLSKKEYEGKMKDIDLGDRDVLREYSGKFNEFAKRAIRENLDLDSRNINSIGDKLYQAKDCYQVFITLSGGRKNENIRYSTDVGEVKDCMDLYIVGPNVSLGYELVEVMESNNVKFSYFIANGRDIEYSLNCQDCHDCFACSGLRKKQYRILNKQYLKDEYYRLLDEIKTKMLLAGEYGEFFPLAQSLAQYNNTYAMIEFPLTEEEVKKNGWQWYDEPEVPVDLKGLKMLRNVPKNIKEVKDDILNKAVICEDTGRPFRLVKAELEFYREHNLPIPIRHPYQRMLDRFKKRNPCRLWGGKCDKCGEKMLTSYPPEKQKQLTIYCHKCYIEKIG